MLQTELPFVLHGAGVEGMAALTYLDDDPYAVMMTIHTGETPVIWSFARELLKGGGIGDVKVKRVKEKVAVMLSSPSGIATLIFKRKDIDAFVHMMYVVVPDGEESDRIDWDKELAYLTREKK